MFYLNQIYIAPKKNILQQDWRVTILEGNLTRSINRNNNGIKLDIANTCYTKLRFYIIIMKCIYPKMLSWY
jgi:hypothetical protein